MGHDGRLIGRRLEVKMLTFEARGMRLGSFQVVRVKKKCHDATNNSGRRNRHRTPPQPPPLEIRTLLQFWLYHEQQRDIKALEEHSMSGWDHLPCSSWTNGA